MIEYKLEGEKEKIVRKVIDTGCTLYGSKYKYTGDIIATDGPSKCSVALHICGVYHYRKNRIGRERYINTKVSRTTNHSTNKYTSVSLNIDDVINKMPDTYEKHMDIVLAIYECIILHEVTHMCTGKCIHSKKFSSQEFKKLDDYILFKLMETEENNVDVYNMYTYFCNISKLNKIKKRVSNKYKKRRITNLKEYMGDVVIKYKNSRKTKMEWYVSNGIPDYKNKKLK